MIALTNSALTTPMLALNNYCIEIKTASWRHRAEDVEILIACLVVRPELDLCSYICRSRLQTEDGGDRPQILGDGYSLLCT